MFDISLRFFNIKRPDMAGGNDPLAELHHVRALQNLPEFWLANQKALLQCMVTKLKIGQHAQLFNGTCREILCFVNN